MTQTKKLADVTRKATEDRASKLFGGGLPIPATPPAPIEQAAVAEQAPNNAETGASTVTEVQPTSVVPEVESASSQPVAETKPVKTEKGKRGKGASTSDQAVPGNIKCDKVAMITSRHHEILRVIAFKQRKPITAVLYSLLESNPIVQEELKNSSL